MPRKPKPPTDDQTVDERADTGDADLDEAYAKRAALKVVPDEAPPATPAPPIRRQPELPGTERASDAAIDKLAAEYVEKSAQRGQLSADLKTLNAKLQQALEDRGIKSYRFVDGEVEHDVVLTTSKTKIKVIKVGGGEDDED